MKISKKEASRYPDELGWVIHSLEGKTPIIQKWNSNITLENCKKLLEANTNIGVLTGSKSGIVVWDCDKLKDKDGNKLADGVKMMEQCFKKYGEPQTVKAISGGGFHYYFKYDEKTKQLAGGSNRTKTTTGKPVKWDILTDTADMKSQNVVLPPSEHPESHINYKWERSPFDWEILEMPDWLFKMLIKKEQPKPNKIVQLTYEKKDVENRLKLLSDERRGNGSYTDWIKVGMTIKGCSIILKDNDWGFRLWDEWSSEGDNYDDRIMEKTWKSFTAKHPEWSYGSLCNMAKMDSQSEYLNLVTSSPLKFELSNRIIANIFRDDVGHSEIIGEIFKNDLVCVDPVKGNGFLWNESEKLWEPYEESQLSYKVSIALEKVCITYRSQIENDITLSQETKKEKDKHVSDVLNKKVRRAGHIKNVLYFLRSQIYNAKFFEKLRNSPKFLPIRCGNVLNLQTGEIRLRTKQDMFTFECPVGLGDGEHMVEVEECMMDFMGSEEKVKYLQTVSGFLLTGEVSDRMMFTLCGGSGGGKTKYIAFIDKILGEFHTPVAKEVFFKSRGTERHEGAHSSHLIQTIGKRVGTFAESKKDDRLNEGTIKALTGGDFISARAPFGKHNISFKSYMKPVLLTNFKPNFDTEDDAIVERMRYIPFTTKFVDNPKLPNEKKRDTNKINLLLNDYLDDVLLWMLQGSMRYYKEGLITPECLIEEKKKFIEEIDPVSQFILENLEFGKETKGYLLKMSICYSSFVDYCLDNDMEKMNNRAFAQSMRNRGFDIKTKNNALYLENCRLKSE